MAEIVATCALSHAPSLTGWLYKAPKDKQKKILEGFQELGALVRAKKPDYIIGIANDHALNMPFDNTWDFCVGTASEWTGPAEWFKDWVALPEYKVKGNAEHARTLAAEINRAGIRMAFSDDLLFDDNWSVPLHFVTPEHDVPLIPIHMNCIVPPVPSTDLCHQLGVTLADIVRRALPKGDRVVIMATGGLSHDPGGPKYFLVDEEYDRWFMSLLEEGNPEKVLKEATIESMLGAGDGGTVELLAWISAMGAAGDRPARSICYEAVDALRCGLGCSFWDME